MRLCGEERLIAINVSDDNVGKIERYTRAGFQAAELDMPVFFREKRDMRVFAPWLESAYPQIMAGGLRVCSYHLPFGMDWDISHTDEAERRLVVKDLKEIIGMTEGLMGDVVVVHTSAEPIAEDARKRKIAACQESLYDLSAAAAGVGKRLALENLPRTCLGNTSEEMMVLTKNGTICGMCMDTTHLFHETVPHYLDVCGEHVIHTHLSDYMYGQDECHWVPGTGDIPWRDVFLKLSDLHYGGAYMFEVGGKYAPLEIIGGLKNSLKEADL